MITHEEAKELLYGMALNPTSNKYEILLKYISQQQKKSELLKMYKELDSYMPHTQSYRELKSEISQKEKEMEK